MHILGVAQYHVMSQNHAVHASMVLSGKMKQSFTLIVLPKASRLLKTVRPWV